MSSLGRTPEKSLEVGIGSFGLGISAFLPEIPFRLALDPLPPVSLDSSPDSELHSTYELRAYMQSLRAPIHYVQSCGEEMPVRTGTIDLVICCNVLDHVSDPDAVSIASCLYFDVDTFSLCGLVKWFLWTKHAHADEILVTAHPYRMFEAGLMRRLHAAAAEAGAEHEGIETHSNPRIPAHSVDKVTIAEPALAHSRLLRL
jgi:hypothetical protein